MAFKMTGTSLYKKVSTRGGSTMMKHKEDAWGFKHGSEHHRDENKPHEEGGDPYAKKNKTVMKHAKDSSGFEHGKKYHMAPAQDVAARGSGATAYYESLAKKRKAK